MLLVPFCWASLLVAHTSTQDTPARHFAPRPLFQIVRMSGKSATDSDKEINRDDENTFDVVIIGAGWAGLAAAKTLQENGCTNMCILEARDYVGGRSVTSYECGGCPVDLGSSWIHGRDSNKNPVQRLVRDYKLPYAPSGEEAFALWDANGQLLSKKQADKMYKREKNFLKYMERRQEKDKSDTTMEEVVKDYIAEKCVSADEEVGLRWMLDAEVVQEYAASLTELSLKFWDIDDEIDGGDSYLAVDSGGYSSVMKQYAASVESLVRLGTKVNSIDYTNDTVTICCTHASTGNKCTTMKAKHAIVTLPLGVLKAGTVRFSPELPKAKTTAIRSLGCGRMNKIVLWWEKMDESDIFWPKEKEWILIMKPTSKTSSQSSLHVREFFNPGCLDPKQRILIGFVIADQAEKMEKLKDDEIADAALSSLRRIFHDKVPTPTKVLVTRWGSDEFSLGAYSFQKIGSKENSRKDLARPVNNSIWFAGEATDRKFPATTHGALLSGKRAGKSVASMLS